MLAVAQRTMLLPEPFASAKAGAYVQYGRRVITWNIAGPGELFRNHYERCWIEISEREPWRGEPLWLSALRWASPDSSARVGFTDKARQSLQDLLVPRIARYGFTRLWLDLHRQKGDEGAANARDQAKREAAWWDAKTLLADMHAEGIVEFRPINQDPRSRAFTMPVLNVHRLPDYEPVAAEALVDGEHVGWMTSHGHLVPDRSILEDRP